MKKENSAGFSLIELLVVLAIIGLLGAVVAPRVMKHLGEAKVSTARLQIEDLGAALDMFYLDNGRYPDIDEGLYALIKKPSGLDFWGGPYLKKKKIPKDPWGNEYQYRFPGQYGDYDLFSYGADSRDGGQGKNASINSWE